MRYKVTDIGIVLGKKDISNHKQTVLCFLRKLGKVNGIAKKSHAIPGTVSNLIYYTLSDDTLGCYEFVEGSYNQIGLALFDQEKLRILTRIIQLLRIHLPMYEPHIPLWDAFFAFLERFGISEINYSLLLQVELELLSCCGMVSEEEKMLLAKRCPRIGLDITAGLLDRAI